MDIFFNKRPNRSNALHQIRLQPARSPNVQSTEIIIDRLLSFDELLEIQIHLVMLFINCHYYWITFKIRLSAVARNLSHVDTAAQLFWKDWELLQEISFWLCKSYAIFSSCLDLQELNFLLLRLIQYAWKMKSENLFQAISTIFQAKWCFTERWINFIQKSVLNIKTDPK